MFEPIWCTAGPSTWRSAACSRCVAVCSRVVSLGVVGQPALELALHAPRARRSRCWLVAVLEAGFVHAQPLLAGQLDGQRQREAVGLEQVEGLLAADLRFARAVQPLGHLVELPQAALQGVLELASPRCPARSAIMSALLVQLGVDVAEQVDHHAGQRARRSCSWMPSSRP